jgi:uncharacterized membrane protein required for colicin V production
MNSWNGLDFIIFLILVSNTVLGMSRGGSREIISMMCLSAALIVTIAFTMPLANFLNSSSVVYTVVDNSMIQNFMEAIEAGPMTANLLMQLMYSISLLICFVGAFSICEAGLAKSGFTESYGLATAVINRKVGGALGFMRGYIIALVFISILVLHIYQANNNIGSRFVTGSYFVGIFKGQAQVLDGLISSQQTDQYHKLYENQPYKVEDLYKDLHKQADIVAPAETPAPAAPSAATQAQPLPVPATQAAPAVVAPVDAPAPASQ